MRPRRSSTIRSLAPRSDHKGGPSTACRSFCAERRLSFSLHRAHPCTSLDVWFISVLFGFVDQAVLAEHDGWALSSLIQWSDDRQFDHLWSREIKEDMFSHKVPSVSTAEEFWKGASARHPWLRPVGNTLIGLMVQAHRGSLPHFTDFYSKMLQNHVKIW